jgi:hypothetical protein
LGDLLPDADGKARDALDKAYEEATEIPLADFRLTVAK